MRKVINQNRLRTWEAAGGVFCFLAGIVTALLGSLLTASGWIVGAEIHPWVHAAGTALLIVTIPLILFAGFCLDWSERRPNKARDNDRDPGEGKVPPEPIMISKQIERRLEEGRFSQDREIRLIAAENGNGERTLHKTGLYKSLKTRGEHFANDSERIESARGLVGKRASSTV